MSLILEGSPMRVSIQNRGHGEAGEWATGNRVCALQSIDPPRSCSNCAGKRQEIEYSSQKAISTLTSDKGTTSPMLNNSIGGAEMHVHVPQEQVTIRYTGLEGGEMGNSVPQYTDQNFTFNESRDLLRRQILGAFWNGNCRAWNL